MNDSLFVEETSHDRKGECIRRTRKRLKRNMWEKESLE